MERSDKLRIRFPGGPSKTWTRYIVGRLSDGATRRQIATFLRYLTALMKSQRILPGGNSDLKFTVTAGLRIAESTQFSFGSMAG